MRREPSIDFQSALACASVVITNSTQGTTDAGSVAATTWHKEEYDATVKKIIGKRRAALWKRVAEDRKIYPMSSYEWLKEEIALEAELSTLKRQQP